MQLEAVVPRWRRCIIAAPGPDLKPVPVYDWNVIAVQDAYKDFPQADILYGCDPSWWDGFQGGFDGELWSTHDVQKNVDNDKTELADRLDIHCVEGRWQNKCDASFSTDPSYINYGDNSGFQALNLAILLGCERIILIGYNLSGTNKFQQRDFHSPYHRFIEFFNKAAETLPSNVEVINATPNSALECFPKMRYEDAIHNSAAA
jgi:hypothetical protein